MFAIKWNIFYFRRLRSGDVKDLVDEFENFKNAFEEGTERIDKIM